MNQGSLIFEGKVYQSSKRASALTGYTTDYIGQLCRGHKANCKLVGRTWYVEQNSLCGHKAQKRISDAKDSSMNGREIKRKGVYTESQRMLIEELTKRSQVIHAEEPLILFESEDMPLYPPLTKTLPEYTPAYKKVARTVEVAVPIASPVQIIHSPFATDVRQKRPVNREFSLQGILIPVGVAALFILATLGLEATYSYTNNGGVQGGVSIVSASEMLL